MLVLTWRPVVTGDPVTQGPRPLSAHQCSLSASDHPLSGVMISQEQRWSPSSSFIISCHQVLIRVTSHLINISQWWCVFLQFGSLSSCSHTPGHWSYSTMVRSYVQKRHETMTKKRLFMSSYQETIIVFVWQFNCSDWIMIQIFSYFVKWWMRISFEAFKHDGNLSKEIINIWG